jgi:hypothetical protein
MYGREARLPVDLSFSILPGDMPSPAEYARKLELSLSYAYDVVRSVLGKVQQRQKLLYDKKIHGEPFKSDDLVWLHSSVVPRNQCRKLYHPWIGPYRILKKISDVNYKIAPLQQPWKHSVVHFDRLKHCLRDSNTHSSPEEQAYPPYGVDTSSYPGQNALLVTEEEDMPLGDHLLNEPDVEHVPAENMSEEGEENPDTYVHVPQAEANLDSSSNTIIHSSENLDMHVQEPQTEAALPVDSLSNVVNSPSPSPRYPHRERNKPDWFHPFVSTVKFGANSFKGGSCVERRPLSDLGGLTLLKNHPYGTF